MEKYIKAEDVKDLLIGLDSLPWEEEVDDIIEQLKTANVKEVVHAKWERKYDIDKGIYWHECSNCGCKPPRNQWSQEYDSNYCPDCGAEMRYFEEDNDEDIN